MDIIELDIAVLKLTVDPVPNQVGHFTLTSLPFDWLIIEKCVITSEAEGRASFR